MKPYQDPGQDYRTRAVDLLQRMTIEEKLAQLLHPWEKDDAKIVETYGATGVGFLYTFFVNDPDAVQRKIMERSRLKAKIRTSKDEILSFIRKNGEGRIFLDHKHLTLRSGSDSISLPFSQVTRFCMEDMVPVDKLLDNVGKSAVVIGSFEQHHGGARISIGERAVVGNTIVYREKTFLVE